MLCIRNDCNGQFFTPYAVSKLMAVMLVGDPAARGQEPMRTTHRAVLFQRAFKPLQAASGHGKPGVAQSSSTASSTCMSFTRSAIDTMMHRLLVIGDSIGPE